MNTLEKTNLGRYRIIGELGRGAMGVVYKAEDPSLGRVVAIKAVELAPDASNSQEYEARFYQEAKAAGSLNHPGIISIYDSGRDGDWAYIAMEVLEGVELRDLMAAGRLALPRVLDIAEQVANALNFAHDSGVVHRDIKPGNIMIMKGDHAKIMDFGIARTRVSTVKTQIGVVLGSPKYMSPEQVVGKRVDHRSDIFSLGVMMFEMIAGIAPFSGNDIAELMFAVVNTREARVSQFNPDTPELLDLIVAKALQKDAIARYQSARELAADLAICRASLGSGTTKSDAAIGEATVPLRADSTATQSFHGGIAGTADATGASDVQTVRIDQRVPEARVDPAAAQFDATTIPMSTTNATRTVPNQLVFSRRFSSAAALARLADSAHADKREFSQKPVATGRTFMPPAYLRNRLVALAIFASILGAVAIAFY